MEKRAGTGSTSVPTLASRWYLCGRGQDTRFSGSQVLHLCGGNNNFLLSTLGRTERGIPKCQGLALSKDLIMNIIM